MSDKNKENKKVVVFEKNCRIVINGEIKAFKKGLKKSFVEDLANKLIENKVAKEYIENSKTEVEKSSENNSNKVINSKK